MKKKLIALILTVTVIASSVLAAFALSPKDGWYTDADSVTYYYNNGEAVTGLQEIDGDMYYFGNDGVLQIGFIETSTALYYFDPDAQLGWHEDESGNTYYFYPAALTGLQEIRGSLYYFDEGGTLQTNVWYDGYYFGSDGIPVTGLQKIAGVTYYFDESGIMQTGWIEIDSKKYYFGSDGVMLTGLQEIDGEIYFLSTSDGHMLTSTLKSSGNDTYYFAKDGTALTDDTVTIDGYIYSFGSDGKMTGKTAVESETETTEKETTVASSASSSTSSSSSSSATKNSSSSKSYSYKTYCGTITIGSYSENLYTSASNSYWQTIVNDSDSCLICVQGGEQVFIADHQNQGLNVLWNTSTGDTATITLANGTTLKLTCTKVYSHIFDSVLENYLSADEIMIKTCESGGGSTYGNRVTLWSISGMTASELISYISAKS